ncbi:MAG TPA: hypothetical protein VF070_37510 [Streptosporangiaceae bacterium]
MRHVLRGVLAIILITVGVVGCAASRGPGATGAVSASAMRSQPSAGTTSARPSISRVAIAYPAGSKNLEANLPNPGTGAGDPRLIAALLPQSMDTRFYLPPAVVAMPDTDRRSLFIGLRQYGSPVAGPPECEGWTAGIWTVVVSEFNQRGVQLAVTQQMGPDAVQFSEAIITGPSAVLGSLANPELPPSCRRITGATPYSGGVRLLTAPGIGVVSWAYEVTGTGKFPIWAWAEVVRGPGFILEVSIPVQSSALHRDLAPALPRIAAAAYQRAVLKLGLCVSGIGLCRKPGFRRRWSGQLYRVARGVVGDDLPAAPGSRAYCRGQ